MTTETTARIGEVLRKAREARGESLESVSQELRIRLDYLAGLEAGDWSRFPAEVYGQGFLRTYAKHLGLNADELVAWRRAELAAVAPTPAPAEVGQPRREAVRRSPATASGRGYGWAIAALLVIFVGGLWLIRQRHQTTALPRPSAAPSHLSLPATPSRARPSTPPSTPIASAAGAVRVLASQTQTTVEVSQAPIAVSVQFQAPCWVQAWSNGTEVNPGTTYYAGQELALTGQSSVRLVLGNSGGAQLTVNGHALGTVGPSGAVRTVQVVVTPNA